MPRTSLTVQTVSRATPLVNSTRNVPDAANGNSFVNNGRVYLYVTNNDAASRTLTMPVVQTVDGLAVASRTAVITTGQRVIIGPFPTEYYNQTDGTMNLDWSASTNVTIELLAVPG